MTVKLSQERKVRSLAKKTLVRRGWGGRFVCLFQFLGSVLAGMMVIGRGLVLMKGRYVPGAVWRRGWLDILIGRDWKRTNMQI